MKFETCMAGWPLVGYGHILAYFIMCPGGYTLEQLLCWKQLEGYNYFQSNYVGTIHIRTVENGAEGLCVLNPSQHTPDKANQAWVAVKLNGHVVTAHYTCMAG